MDSPESFLRALYAEPISGLTSMERWRHMKHGLSYTDLGGFFDLCEETDTEIDFDFLRALFTLVSNKKAYVTCYLLEHDEDVRRVTVFELGSLATRMYGMKNLCKSFRISLLLPFKGLRFYLVAYIDGKLIKNWWDEMTEKDYRAAVIRAAQEFLEDEVWN